MADDYLCKKGIFGDCRIMNTGVRIQQPVKCGHRTVFPIVRDSSFCHEGGAILSITPVALLIEEEGRWSFAPLEKGTCTDILGKLL